MLTAALFILNTDAMTVNGFLLNIKQRGKAFNFFLVVSVSENYLDFFLLSEKCF
jgi:hypothetical protein